LLANSVEPKNEMEGRNPIRKSPTPKNLPVESGKLGYCLVCSPEASA